MTKSFDRLATVTASTKRSPTISGGGLIGTPTTNISSVSITPLDPADAATRAELQERLGLETPMILLQTFVGSNADIVEGDILVVSGTEYPIRAVGDWSAGGSAPVYKRLIVEELKRASG